MSSSPILELLHETNQHVWSFSSGRTRTPRAGLVGFFQNHRIQRIRVIDRPASRPLQRMRGLNAMTAGSRGQSRGSTARSLLSRNSICHCHKTALSARIRIRLALPAS